MSPPWIIFCILAVILVILISKIARAGKRRPRIQGAASSRDLIDLSLRDARPGDEISVHAAGDEYDDLQFTSDRRNRYESGNETWYELSGIYRGRRVYVEYWDDDGLQVVATTNTSGLRLEDLGIEEADLIRMDEEQKKSNSIRWDGHRWTYQSSYEIGYFEDGVGEGEGYYCWEFECDDQQRILSVEKWEGEPFEIVLSHKVHAEDVKVFRS